MTRTIPDILGRRALSAGRLAALGATLDFHHGLLQATIPVVMLSVIELLRLELYAAVGIGLIAAISLGRLMQESLFDVKPMDAPTPWPSPSR